MCRQSIAWSLLPSYRVESLARVSSVMLACIACEYPVVPGLMRSHASDAPTPLLSRGSLLCYLWAEQPKSFSHAVVTWLQIGPSVQLALSQTVIVLHACAVAVVFVESSLKSLVCEAGFNVLYPKHSKASSTVSAQQLLGDNVMQTECGNLSELP